MTKKVNYVPDTWFEYEIRPRLHGEAHYIRYADGFLIMFQYENDAKAIMNVLPKRLGRFSLEVAENKIRILPFGRFKGTKEDFDFLGLATEDCLKSRMRENRTYGSVRGSDIPSQVVST